LIKWAGSETDDYHVFENKIDEDKAVGAIKFLLDYPMNEKIEEIVIMVERE